MPFQSKPKVVVKDKCPYKYEDDDNCWNQFPIKLGGKIIYKCTPRCSLW